MTDDHPPVADRRRFEQEIERLRTREKAHTREGDAGRLHPDPHRRRRADLDPGPRVAGGPTHLPVATPRRRPLRRPRRSDMNARAVQDAYLALIDAAGSVAGDPVPPEGEWDVDQVLAHVALVTSLTVTAVSTVASGLNAVYDNRTALDPWTIDHVVTLAGGRDGLCERLRLEGEALDLLGQMLGERELAAAVPTRLLSNGELLVDQTMTLDDILRGLVDVELPAHTQQIRALDV
jgi:hypothetical protein